MSIFTLAVPFLSRLTLFLLETKGIRHFARPLIHSFKTTLPDGSRIYMDGEGYGDQKFIVNEIYNHEIYERKFRLRPGYVVFDVGANIGVFSLKAAKLIGPSGILLAIEPATRTFVKLRKNISINKFQNIRALQCAAGASEGQGTLYLERRYDGHSSFYKRRGQEGAERVPIRTLDNILEASGLQRCEFLKIDTEGSELDILKGAEHILSDLRPYVSMETHEFGSKPEEISEFLAKRHYFVQSQVEMDGSAYLYAHPVS